MLESDICYLSLCAIFIKQFILKLNERFPMTKRCNQHTYIFIGRTFPLLLRNVRIQGTP